MSQKCPDCRGSLEYEGKRRWRCYNVACRFVELKADPPSRQPMPSVCTAGDGAAIDCRHCAAPPGVTCADHKAQRASEASQESKWPCYWCGSMQAHETGWIGGSSLPACNAHAGDHLPPEMVEACPNEAWKDADEGELIDEVNAMGKAQRTNEAKPLEPRFPPGVFEINTDLPGESDPCAQCGAADAPYVEHRCMLHVGGQTELACSDNPYPPTRIWAVYDRRDDHIDTAYNTRQAAEASAEATNANGYDDIVVGPYVLEGARTETASFGGEACPHAEICNGCTSRADVETIKRQTIEGCRPGHGMIDTLLVPGDVVRVNQGLNAGRTGPIVRMQRQSLGERQVIVWVRIARGETHAFYPNELNFVSYAPSKRSTDR